MSDYEFKVGHEGPMVAGGEARVLMDGGAGAFPLVGARRWTSDEEWLPTRWARNGRERGGDGSTDLLPPEPVKVVRWLNIYDVDGHHVCGDLQFAPSDAERVGRLEKRIACVRMEYTEGQFDE